MNLHTEIGRGTVAFRRRRLAELRALRNSLEDEMKREADCAGVSFCTMRLPLKIRLLRELVRIVNARDKALPDLVHGLPNVGSALCGPTAHATWPLPDSAL